jgi:hypothetical protein
LAFLAGDTPSSLFKIPETVSAPKRMIFSSCIVQLYYIKLFHGKYVLGANSNTLGFRTASAGNAKLLPQAAAATDAAVDDGHPGLHGLQ